MVIFADRGWYKLIKADKIWKKAMKSYGVWVGHSVHESINQYHGSMMLIHRMISLKMQVVHDQLKKSKTRFWSFNTSDIAMLNLKQTCTIKLSWVSPCHSFQPSASLSVIPPSLPEPHEIIFSTRVQAVRLPDAAWLSQSQENQSPVAQQVEKTVKHQAGEVGGTTGWVSGGRAVTSLYHWHCPGWGSSPSRWSRGTVWSTCYDSYSHDSYSHKYFT